MKNKLISTLIILSLVMGSASVAFAQAPNSNKIYVANRVVTIKNNAYMPSRVTIKRGTSVTWINRDPAAHTVTAANGSFDSGNLPAGQRFTIRFNTPGLYNYYCKYHTWMKGVIIVR